MNLERRFVPVDQAELRAVPLEGQGGLVVEGYAWVYDTPSVDLGGFREILAPGCFNKSLQGSDLRALLGHDTSLLLGREKSGTLEVRPDAKGGKVRIHLPDTSTGRDVAVSLDRGDLDGMSFAMVPTKDEWASTPQGLVCTILEAEIYEVSIVSFPAYQATSVSLRSIERAKQLSRKRSLEVLERRIRILKSA